MQKLEYCLDWNHAVGLFHQRRWITLVWMVLIGLSYRSRWNKVERMTKEQLMGFYRGWY